MDVLAPFGFRPSFHTSGSANPRQQYGSIETPPTKGLASQMPVQLINGIIVPAVTYGTPNEVAPVKAIFGGISYADQNGFQKEYPNIVANTPTFNQGVSGVNQGYPSNTFVKPYLYMDPDMEFVVQANGTLNKDALGQTYDIDPSTIDDVNTTGISLVALSNTPTADGAGNFIVTKLYQDVKNTWGDAYTVVWVKLNQTNF